MSDAKHTPGPWVASDNLDAPDCPCAPCVRGRNLRTELAAAGVPTEGPWVAEDDWALTVESPSGRVASLAPFPRGERRPGADARLIAAAPDLLAALKMAERRLSSGPISVTSTLTGEVLWLQSRDLPTIQAAIAKAEGKP